MKYAIGIDVGGMSIKFGLFDAEGTLLQTAFLPTEVERGAADALDRMAAQAHALMEQKGLAWQDLVGVGVGVPGPVENENWVAHCVNLHWRDVAVATELTKRLGVPVKAANDANVAALGEAWKGAGQGHERLVLFTLGTGVGGGVIDGGRILAGAHGAGGEVGHIPVLEAESERRCNCGGRRCLELVASGTGIAAQAQNLLQQSTQPSVLRALSDLEAKDVLDAAKAGDALAKQVVDFSAETLGRACALIAGVVDPELFVIGGGVSRAGDTLLEPVRAAYRRWVFAPLRETPIVVAALGNDAGMYGAARLVL